MTLRLPAGIFMGTFDVVSHRQKLLHFFVVPFSGFIIVFFLSSLSIFYRYAYSFQHSNYISCIYPKSNNTSKGELTTNSTSVVLNDLLPCSLYSVEVAACTVQYGRATVKLGNTLCLGKLF